MDRPAIHPVNSAMRGAAWGGGATALATADVLASLYVAGIMALVSGLGNWGRNFRDHDNPVVSLLGHIAAGFGGA